MSNVWPTRLMKRSADMNGRINYLYKVLVKQVPEWQYEIVEAPDIATAEKEAKGIVISMPDPP